MSFPKLSLTFAAAASVLAAAGQVVAQQLWDGNAGGSNYDWSTGGNWVSGTAPTSNTITSNTATFDNTALSGNRVPNLDSSRSIGGLVFGGTGYTLGSTGGFTLTIGAGRIVGNAAGTNIINHNTAAITSITGTNTYATLSNGSNLALNGTTTFDFSGVDIGIRLGSFTVGASSTLTIGGTIALNNTSSGSEIRLNKSGDGMLQLNVANAFTGWSRVTLTGGTISVSVNGALGSMPIVSVNGSAPSKAIWIDTAGLTLDNQIQFLNGSIASTGNITTHTIGGTNTSGTATFNSGATALELSNSYAEASATNAQKLTLFTAASGGRVEFKSVIRDNGSALRTGGINKVGLGAVALYGANTYTLGTVVTAGTLLVNNTTGSGTAAGAVTVNPGASLGGTGTISAGANTVSVSGTLLVGDGASATDLNITTTGAGALTLNANSFATFDIFAVNTADKLITSGTTTIGSSVTLTLLNTGGVTFANGQSYDVFDWGTTPGGTFASTMLPSLDVGLSWDTSALYTTGIVSVVAVPEPSTYVGGALMMLCGAVSLLHKRRDHPKWFQTCNFAPFAASAFSARQTSEVALWERARSGFASSIQPERPG